MRTIGNLFLLAMVAIFASGFLLAHTINITQEMSELKANLARTQD
jgi:hypothetical protein